MICVVRTIPRRRLPQWVERRRAAVLTALALAAVLAFSEGGLQAARVREPMQNGDGSVVRGIVESTPDTEVAGASKGTGVAGASQRAGVLEDVVLSLERAQGEGWHAEDLQVALSARGTQLSVVLTVARLQLDTLEKALSGVRIECPRLELSAAAFGCAEARMEANWPVIGRQVLDAQVRYGRRDAAFSISLDGLRLDSGSARLRGEVHGAAWTGELHASAMPLSTLLQLAQAASLPVAGWSAQGAVTLSARAGGTGRALTAARFDASLSGLTVNNDSGSIASDGLAMRVRGEARRGAGSPVTDGARNEVRGRARDEAGADHDLRRNTLMDTAMDRGHAGKRDLYFTMQVESDQGQAYVQPVFLDFGMHAISLEATGTLAAGQALVIERFAVSHADVAQASGAARIEPAAGQPLRFLRLDLAGLHFPGAYESYLQPVLLDTGFKSMRTSGRLAGRVVVAEGVPQDVELTLDDLSLDDDQGAFALSGLTGEANWSLRASAPDDAVAQASHVQWRDGTLFGLALGPVDLHVLANGRQLRLLQPTRIPVLDGALDVERFRIRNMGLPKLAFLIDATIEPISVPQLCKSFGWPQFGGQLAGKVSDLRMREGVITLGDAACASLRRRSERD